MKKCASCMKDFSLENEDEVRLTRVWWDAARWICIECWTRYRFDALLAPVRFMIDSNRQYRGEDTPEFVINVDLIEACQQARNALNELPGHEGTKRVLTDVIERALGLVKSAE